MDAKTTGQYHLLFERQIERVWRATEPELARCWTRAGYNWPEDREAVRHGFFGAFHWASEDSWTPELEALLERDWLANDPELEWDDVDVLVRHGWNEGRRHVTGYPHATTGEREAEEWYSEGLGA
jgi:hypothetical protein